MMRTKSRARALLRLAGAAAIALSLAGCISLLPKTKPANLYRFGGPATEVPIGRQTATVGVFRANSIFQREAAGDRILTIENGKVAYLAETRWVAPAAILWDEAVLGAFDADTGPTRLILRGELAAGADYILRLDVRNFEARYDQGPKAPPTVLVRVRSTITRVKDSKLMSEQIFESRVPASDNRVSAIVPAYDQAVRDVLTEVVAWTNEQAKPV